MITLSVANQKGGVGKTTTAVNLAACLARDGCRTLLIDFDHQANASDHLGVEAAANERETAWALLGEKQPDIDAILKPCAPNLSIATGHIALAEIDLQLQSAVARELRLARALEQCGNRFEYVVIDCAPSVGVATINALCASQRAIITVQTNRFALDGVSRLLRIVADVRESINPALGFYGLATMHRVNVNVNRNVLAAFQQFFDKVALKTVIKFTATLAEASAAQQSIVDYAHGSGAHKNYQELAKEVRSLVEQQPQTQPQAQAI